MRGLHCPKHAQLSISHRFFPGVFLCVSHFASVFAVFWPSLDFLHMRLRLAFVFQLGAGVLGGDGGGRG